jgi:integrase
MAKRVQHKLTSLEVTRLRKPGRHGDGGGLDLVIDGKGRKRWVLRYRFGDKRRDMGLGAAEGSNAVSSADVRAAAAEARALVKAGTDPLDARAQRTQADAEERGQVERNTSAPTFGAYADAYVERHQSAWKNAKHIAQWKMTLTVHAKPIRDLKLSEIETAAVLSVLQPLWVKVPETAQRLRGRIEKVLDAAKVEGHRTGENPARWRGHLEALLPKRQKLTRGHHAALPFERMPEFMEALRSREAIAARLLEFCILTATRSGEALGAEWSEIDLGKTVWTIAPGRMKGGRAHRVPLSDRAVEILRQTELVKGSKFAFPGRGLRPLSNMAMAQLLERMGFGEFTVHGFRSTFRDWASETTGFPHDVCEMALAHTIANKAEAAYRRGDLLEKRRELMAAWAAYCQPKADNVIKLRMPA